MKTTSPAPTPAKLRGLARDWQKRLRLRDWDLTIAYDRSPEFLALGCEGMCQMIPPLKTARITILHPADYHPDLRGDIDLEQVVCHELIHLHLIFAPADDSEDGYMSPGTIAMEQATELIAQALVDAKRSPP